MPAPERLRFLLTPRDVDLICEALMTFPAGRVLPTLGRLNDQLEAQGAVSPTDAARVTYRQPMPFQVPAPPAAPVVNITPAADRPATEEAA